MLRSRAPLRLLGALAALALLLTQPATAGSSKGAQTAPTFKVLAFYTGKNMGHNDMDYENKTNRQLSSTFSSPAQNELITRALKWLGEPRAARQ